MRKCMFFKVNFFLIDLYDVIRGKKHKGPGTNEIVWIDHQFAKK